MSDAINAKSIFRDFPPILKLKKNLSYKLVINGYIM